jgi:hypothetical protein
MVVDGLITRALKDAIAHCKTEFEAEMNEQVPGARPTPEALAWRARATEYQRLATKIEPAREKQAAGEKP